MTEFKIMTPLQKLKWAILKKEGLLTIAPTTEIIESVWDAFNETYEAQDAKDEFRQGEEYTHIATQFSEHYECKPVAAEMPDGTWVGWNYWYGGGRHSEPSEIEWMEDAYEVSFHEETIVVKRFNKVGT